MLVRLILVTVALMTARLARLDVCGDRKLSPFRRRRVNSGLCPRWNASCPIDCFIAAGQPTQSRVVLIPSKSGRTLARRSP